MHKQRTVGQRIQRIFTLTGRLANCLAGSVVPRAVPLLPLPSVRLSIRRPAPPLCDVMTQPTYAGEDLRSDMKSRSYLFLNLLPPWDLKNGLSFQIAFVNVNLSILLQNYTLKRVKLKKFDLQRWEIRSIAWIKCTPAGCCWNTRPYFLSDPKC